MMFDCQQREDHLCRLKLWRRRTALHRKLVSLLLLLHRSCLLFKYAEKMFNIEQYRKKIVIVVVAVQLHIEIIPMQYLYQYIYSNSHLIFVAIVFMLYENKPSQ